MVQWAHFALAVVSRHWANGGSEFVVLRCYFIQRINVYRSVVEWIERLLLVDSGSIPGRVKPKTIKIGIRSFSA